MLKKEFEEISGIVLGNAPWTKGVYKLIEELYYLYPSSQKSQFCKFIRNNPFLLDFLKEVNANIAANIANKTSFIESLQGMVSSNLDTINSLQKEINELEKKLIYAEGWEPYEDPNSITDEKYMSEKEHGYQIDDIRATDIVSSWFGFDTGRVTIYRTAPELIKSRDGRVRQIGEKERLPLYFASDLNYVRFDCGQYTYEMVDGELNIV